MLKIFFDHGAPMIIPSPPAEGVPTPKGQVFEANIERVLYIYAEGLWLDYILSQWALLMPHVIGANKMYWYGDLARTIILNL